jgi:hypothetical protein
MSDDAKKLFSAIYRNFSDTGKWGEVMFHAKHMERELDQLRAALRALVQALPKCGVCGQPATTEGWERDDYDCDEHRGERRQTGEVPWAEPLRAAMKLLDGT